MSFIKATKKQAKLRLAVFGPSGSGKTFSALRIAKGLNGKIAVIDSERGSASKYSDKFEFDVQELAPCNIEKLVKAIEEAEEAGYNILIIDSLSHAWQELLEEVDKLATAKFKGNSWSAWSEGTPKQKKLINSILSFNGHIIATIRSKTEWSIQQTDRGSKPMRIGLAPEQGKGIEYEFDMLMEITPDHIANIIKDRTGMFQDKILEKPDEKFGKKLSDWLSEGEPVEFKKEKPNEPIPETKPTPKIKTNAQKKKEEEEKKTLQSKWEEFENICKEIESFANEDDMKNINAMKNNWKKGKLKIENIENGIKFFVDNYNSILYPGENLDDTQLSDDDKIPNFFKETPEDKTIKKNENPDLFNKEASA